tara:strand:- start:4581 stop:4823 length:243 start_codon:yes stop_codon:yes gene_type:complete
MLKFVLMKKLSFLVVFLFMIINNTYAQCAMCKSVVESNMEGGSKIGAGLNDAILFLMAMPYLSLAIIAFVWLRYKKRIKA